MIEFSIGELVCFAAAVVAASRWVFWKHEAHKHLTFVRAMIEDKVVREKVLSDFEDFKKEQSRREARNT